MKRFKQFCAEGMGWKGRQEPPREDGSHRFRTIDHEAHIDGHHVAVEFKERHPHHWSADFAVNHSNHPHREHNVPMETKMKILKHVHHSVNRFVKRVKPKVLIMAANSDEKHALYDKFAARIAKQHGATHHHGREILAHILKFKPNAD